MTPRFGVRTNMAHSFQIFKVKSYLQATRSQLISEEQVSYALGGKTFASRVGTSADSQSSAELSIATNSCHLVVTFQQSSFSVSFFTGHL